jgi:hypothetical protein
MHFPYTDRFPEAVSLAGQSVGAALTAVVWSRPLRTRAANALFGAAIWLAALSPVAPDLTRFFHLSFDLKVTVMLQASATLATLAVLLHGSRGFGVLAVLGQFALYALGEEVRDSNFELSMLYLMWCGVLLGIHALRATPPARVDGPAAGESRAPRRFLLQDALIFVGAIGLALVVTFFVFERVIYNGDEVASTFQADVYGHLRAWAPVPACPSMFENYWVFRHDGRAFSQYTPGWPLFMALFQRLGVIWLAGPVMGGIFAVGIARLSRRAASGLGATPEASARIVAVAGPLGAALVLLGPAMLMNAGSRFSHTMVCACFAWSVESLCVLADRDPAGRPARGYAVLLGAAIALGLATRPSDGATLAVGVFVYFLWALFRRRVGGRSLAFAALGFAAFAGLTLVILRLQLGAWFKTGYSLSASIHPEALLRFSFPHPHEWKYGVPLATGSFCWWPLAPALGVAGLLHAVGGRERRVPFMLAISTLTLLAFYFMLEFGRGIDDGLGPRYTLPVVVPMAVGGAAILAPLGARAWAWGAGLRARLRALGPAVLAAAAVVYGVARIAPLMYPIAHSQYTGWAAPLLGARHMRLKNAIVIIEPGRVPAHETNLAQNPPMDPNPPVLFLIKRNFADEACARAHFPGRTWYRAGMDDKLTRY